MIGPQIQSAGFLLQLSPDWLIERASENSHGFVGEYHQRLIGSPLADFTLAQPLHDLRNSLARQRSSTGIARAYRVRLFDGGTRMDVAFQALDSGLLLEGLPSPEQGVGDWLGSVSRLVDGIGRGDRKRMMEDATRRMRALTGYDRAILTIGDERVESARGTIPDLRLQGELPPMIINASAAPVSLFPSKDEPIAHALLRAPSPEQRDARGSAGIAAVVRVPLMSGGEAIGQFQCENRSPRPASFELHAAAELFAQIFAMMV